MTRALLSLLPVIALAACDGGSDTRSAAGDASSPATSSTADGTSPTASRDTAAILAELGGDYVNADLTNGARQFRRCQSCHTLSDGGRHTVGPNLHGIIGAPAAGADRFSYSSQLAEAGLVWDLDTLDAWIANPRALVPGNRMSFVGLRDADDRRDVIAHIAVETAGD
ncbi:c-type cytochrome [Maricaulis maris]|uniref:Cytochrome c n=1 Tax=Maricaulis maris TaxID=74318 RepID=A0A495D1K4_9PROT|nr:cytochrome c family protein [Maricaulis maris]RKQ95376.1 cytochrome c [Maricaulis maris]